MTLIQELMNQAAAGSILSTSTINRFSPAEIREAIQSLVVDRAKYVASSIANRIWKQRSLFGDSQ